MAAKKRTSTVTRSKRVTKSPAKRRTRKKTAASGVFVFAKTYFRGLLGIAASVAVFTMIFSQVGNQVREEKVAHESEVIRNAVEDPFELAEGLKVGERAAHWSQHLAKLHLQNKGLELDHATPTIEDSAPLMPRQFDCTTFVETVGALAKSQRAGDLYRNILSIRYKNSEGTYWSRNHFPEADWIPNNIEAGNLKDVTAEIAGTSKIEPGTAEKSIDKASWFAKQTGKPVTDRKIASADVKLNYIPKDSIEKILPKLQSGMVINLVRAPNPKQPVLISHQGIIVRKGERVYFQHASTDGNIRIQPLDHYLAKQTSKTWPVVGINVNAWTEGWN